MQRSLGLVPGDGGCTRPHYRTSPSTTSLVRLPATDPVARAARGRATKHMSDEIITNGDLQVDGVRLQGAPSTFGHLYDAGLLLARQLHTRHTGATSPPASDFTVTVEPYSEGAIERVATFLSDEVNYRVSSPPTDHMQQILSKLHIHPATATVITAKVTYLKGKDETPADHAEMMTAVVINRQTGKGVSFYMREPDPRNPFPEQMI